MTETNQQTPEAAQSAAQDGASTAPSMAAAGPAPTLGRIVIVREPHRGDAPAIVTQLYDEGKIGCNIFRGDHLLHTAQHLAQIHPSDMEASGWFWPPRV